MEGWWTIVLFGAVVPAGIMGTLFVRERLPPDDPGRACGMRRAGTGGRHRWGRSWTS